MCALNTLLLGGQAVEICGVTSPDSAADGNLDTFTKVNNAVALADSLFTSGALTGNVGVEVTHPEQMPAGRLASFVIQVPRSLVELSLAKSITVTTDGGDIFGGVETSGGFAAKPFQKLRVTIGGGLSVDLGTSMNVYDTCTQLALDPIDPNNPPGNGSLPVPGIGGDSEGPTGTPLDIILGPLADAAGGFVGFNPLG